MSFEKGIVDDGDPDQSNRLPSSQPTEDERVKEWLGSNEAVNSAFLKWFQSVDASTLMDAFVAGIQASSGLLPVQPAPSIPSWFACELRHACDRRCSSCCRNDPFNGEKHVWHKAGDRYDGQLLDCHALDLRKLVEQINAAVQPAASTPTDGEQNERKHEWVSSHPGWESHYVANDPCKECGKPRNDYRVHIERHTGDSNGKS